MPDDDWRRELGFWFDEKTADRACEFFPKYLRHTEAEWAGQPFHLTDWQAEEIVRPLFGWKRPNGTRQYRTFYGEIARKNGKSELLAGISLLALTGDEEFGGQGYVLAVNRDQAKEIVFHKASVMVGMSPELSAELECFATSIFCPKLMASLKPMSRSVGAKHGFSPSVIAGDELHEWTDRAYYEVFHSGIGARRQPLEAYITTAGVWGPSLCWDFHERALRAIANPAADPSFLGVVYAADQEDDWTDPAVWRKANPNLGVSPKLEALQAACDEAKENPRLENSFRRLHLNQWTEQAVRWLPMARWRKCSDTPKDPNRWRKLEDECAGRVCFGGLDLSSTKDLTALVLLFPPEIPGDRWVILCRFWNPAGIKGDPQSDIEVRMRRDRAPYDTWGKIGALTLTPGDVVHYEAIRDRIFADCQTFDVRAIGFDRWNATDIVQQLLKEDIPMIEFGQGYASMSSPAKQFEKEVFSGQIEHGNHPVLAWNAANVSVKTDESPAANIKPVKDQVGSKIDGIVATIIARGMVLKGDPGPQEIEYQRGDMYA